MDLARNAFRTRRAREGPAANKETRDALEHTRADGSPNRSLVDIARATHDFEAAATGEPKRLIAITCVSAPSKPCYQRACADRVCLLLIAPSRHPNGVRRC